VRRPSGAGRARICAAFQLSLGPILRETPAARWLPTLLSSPQEATMPYRHAFPLLVGGVLCVALLHAQAAPAPAAPSGVAAHPSSGKTGPGSVMHDPATYTRAQADVFLARARQQLGRSHPAAAAADLREGAGTMEKLAGDARGDDSVVLKREAKSLRDIAASVRAGRITTPAALDAQLASARVVLAKHHLLAAADAWARRDYALAGAALAAGARSVDTGLRAAGHATLADVQAAARYGDGLAKRGASATEAGYEHARDAVAKGVEALEAAVGSHRPA
jgi:hypothetical protein